MIQFYRPALSPLAGDILKSVLETGQLSGGGRYTRDCHAILARIVGAGTPFLTTSCTDALEMAALILDLGPGDEVVMPSWTFPSTATAVALRGATPVFVDVDADTLNLLPARVMEALTPATRAVVCVHYAGVACEMDALLALCRDRGIALVEDAAQALGSSWRGRPLGGLGDLSTFSFHGTKNISCGEGGALIVNRPDLVARTEMVWEKGTNRLRFQRGEVHRYEWCDLGSSFLPSEITAALLSVQLEELESVTAARLRAWNRYRDLVAHLECGERLSIPKLHNDSAHNAHIFFVRVRNGAIRSRVLSRMHDLGVDARTHYEPLHRSPAGLRYGRAVGGLPNTEAAAEGIIRLPLDSQIGAADQERVVDALGKGLVDAGER